MRRRAILLLLSAPTYATLQACGHEVAEDDLGAEVGSQRTDASQPPGSDEGADSESNSGGIGGSSSGTRLPPSCITDADCADEVEAYIARLSAPQPSGEPIALTSLSCGVEHERLQTESCACLFDDRVVGIEPCWGFKSDMDGVGRETGLLLYREFAGCTPGDAASCDTACAAVAEAIEQERQHAFDVEIRTVRCVEIQCKVVARIDDHCYSGIVNRGGIMRGPFDCSLTDQEIVKLDEKHVDDSPYPDCFWQPTFSPDE